MKKERIHSKGDGGSASESNADVTFELSLGWKHGNSARAGGTQLFRLSSAI